MEQHIVERALARLDLDAKTRLLAGQDLWSLPALPEIGLRSLVMSDGPIGVRGTAYTAADPALALPSPTALAAAWDPGLARRAGLLLAQEARRKGVHLLLAPTVNLHRSPLAGRHFEAYSEDPYLTGEIGAAYVMGVQDGGVGATVKHFVANDAETDRFTVDNRLSERALRELYLAPFEHIVATARPWAVMSAYNQVNGTTMTEHHRLQVEVLRGEWGFDGVVVSDWLAARDTVRAITGGLDIAMPGPLTVFGPALAAAVRAGHVAEATVDEAVRRVLRLAARAGLLDGAEPAVAADALPADIDGRRLAKEIACRSFVLLRNEGGALPLTPAPGDGVALIGGAAREARIQGGGSATVFPGRVVSPLDALGAALPRLVYSAGADPHDGLTLAGQGFELRGVLRDAHGAVLADQALGDGRIRWMASSLPGGVGFQALDSVEITGVYTPEESGTHHFGTKGIGAFRLVVDGTVLFDGVHRPENGDPLEALTGRPVERGSISLEKGRPVTVSLLAAEPKMSYGPVEGVAFALAHRPPGGHGEALIEEAVAAARTADAAIVVVATTEAEESEGFDRAGLRLPGRQDELVHRVAAVNPRTIVVVNSGAPVEMPWRDEVAAILLSWFPGQEGGDALADVLLGVQEPGGRLPTTWPAALADAPVSTVTPEGGILRYDEELFIGYPAWDRHPVAPAYPFGHGLGYTTWEYEDMDATAERVRVRLRNAGSRPGRETVQIYAAPVGAAEDRPARRLVGFATVTADPGEGVEAEIALAPRAFQVWDAEENRWSKAAGPYLVHASRSAAHDLLAASVLIDPESGA
ncbi:glycoside hydrolase family 3 protein [Bailinhaonella thermotolerans]|uniref:Beta-glucosidase n=1 Tax=Bailinhaonella thermotolerans TaxID=1070861 RepID=A0A3A4A448_9ACTN|nr:glycoside hydrolase family 3 C-terminal domain-containing protein [Bailinhaonella thermotolerans]RJL23265.1 beta-glucosidase [Bailinhaonella thermotolerans]